MRTGGSVGGDASISVLSRFVTWGVGAGVSTTRRGRGGGEAGLTLAQEGPDLVVLADDVVERAATAIADEDVGAAPDRELDEAEVFPPGGLVEQRGARCVI